MSRKREMPDGGAKNALSDLRFGRFVGRIRRSRHPALLLLALFVAACWLTSVNFSVALPRSQWQQAIWSPDIDIIEQMYFSLQPVAKTGVFRCWWAAGLGLVGVLFQQVLRNPLAEPTTLGVATGAQLGITVTTLWAIPGALATQFAALTGACIVGALVFGVAWGKRLSPVTLILAGLVVSLYCGAINQLLVIFHHDQLQSMFLWSTGTLTQTDWSGVQRLWPQLLGGVMLTLLLLRPMTLMGLDDGVARNLGLALSLARLAALSLAIVLSALLVNAVGIIGFIGLFAPLLAKMLGARRLLARLMLAPLSWGAYFVAIRSDYPLAHPRMDGSFHRFSDGANRRAAAPVAAAAA